MPTNSTEISAKRCMAKESRWNERETNAHTYFCINKGLMWKARKKEIPRASSNNNREKNTIIIYSAIFVGHLIRKEQRWTKRFSLRRVVFFSLGVHNVYATPHSFHSVSFGLEILFALLCQLLSVRTPYSCCTCTLCNLCFLIRTKKKNPYGQKIHKWENSTFIGSPKLISFALLISSSHWVNVRVE